ncbi:MAG TPA: hypothetical protein VHZ75_10725 [Solirubrobacteraceae bacterium]|jgi:vacuolar-type H+-ATPase subunit H|nr:hypothetical protein [Solirubrobacteraceae bacterium]
MAEKRASESVAARVRHVEQIVEAAEQAAADMRASAETRAAERIAEAERAADLRVQAADDEAEQVLADARATAQKTEDEGKARARDLIYEARLATRDVLRDGETLSGQLRELSDSLRANAERLLLDIRAAHGEMTARLDRADPTRSGSPASNGGRARNSPPAPSDDPDVPEFLARRSR